MRTRFSIIFALVWLLTLVGWSCQVPVFRYALERWDAEKYRLVIMHRKPLGTEMEKQLIALQEQLSSKNPDVNLTLEVVDINRVDEKARWSLPDMNAMAADHWMVLLSPKGNRTVYSEAFTARSLQKVMNSPAREKWVQKIVKGASVVWVVIPGDDQVEGKATRERLDAILAKAAEEIEVPEGVLKPDEVNDTTGEIDLEDVLRSPIPLKIEFPTMLLDRSDPAEAVFVAMLTQGMPQELRNETVIVPVFGRGRILEPLPASRMTEDLILGGCRYLCGACSCQVKDNNPGTDIVIQEAWQDHLTDGLVVVDRELPPLEGVGDLPKQQHSAKHDPVVATVDQSSDNVMVQSMLAVGAIIILLLIAGTLVLKFKTRRG